MLWEEGGLLYIDLSLKSSLWEWLLCWDRKKWQEVSYVYNIKNILGSAKNSISKRNSCVQEIEGKPSWVDHSE